MYIGDNCNINEGTYIGAKYGKIIIGNHVTFSPYCRLVASMYDIENSWLRGGRSHIEGMEIHISDGTWLCMGASILPGVKITGKGVVVAAGAVVTSDITEDNVLVAGVPARIVKRYEVK